MYIAYGGPGIYNMDCICLKTEIDLMIWNIVTLAGAMDFEAPEEELLDLFTCHRSEPCSDIVFLVGVGGIFLFVTDVPD